MKKKTIWSLALALALVVSAIGASTAALAAAPDTAEPFRHKTLHLPFALQSKGRIRKVL